MKKGRYYEEKTAEIVQQNNPKAQVFQGIRVLGKLTDLKREIDVQLVDASQYDNLVFECKDHKAKVDIELVEALVTKLLDIGSTKGAIVSNSGFTKGAYKAGAAHGIDLLSIVDSNDEKIRTKVFAPQITEDLYLSKASLSLNNIRMAHNFGPDLTGTLIKTPQGNIGWDIVLGKHWNNVHMKNNPKPGEYFLKIEDGTVIDLSKNNIPVGEITIRYFVEKRYYLRNLELIETQGIYDVARQTYQTSSLTTEMIKVEDFNNPQKWEVIDEETAKKMIVPVRMKIITPLPDKI
ncbi:MAG: hypothetical protein JWN28_703 [Candidatus Saccharibacteria bacterium]|nr:hypothetical protein [Candidatus Saccharibacteria bacterium]